MMLVMERSKQEITGKKMNSKNKIVTHVLESVFEEGIHSPGKKCPDDYELDSYSDENINKCIKSYAVCFNCWKSALVKQYDNYYVSEINKGNIKAEDNMSGFKDIKISGKDKLVSIIINRFLEEKEGSCPGAYGLTSLSLGIFKDPFLPLCIMECDDDISCQDNCIFCWELALKDDNYDILDYKEERYETMLNIVKLSRAI